MSVDVVVFAPVAASLTVTVAPGISELPDFTTPEIEKVCVEGASCARELTATSRRMASRRTVALKALE
jgi:hypothetical protein